MWHQSAITTNLLDIATLHEMYDAALTMLSRTGMHLGHAEMRAEVLRQSGFTECHERVCIAPARVQAVVDRWRANFSPEAPVSEPLQRAWVDDRPSWLVERDGITVRHLTTDDAIYGAKLIHMLRAQGIGGSTPGLPQDVPLPLQPLEQFMIGARYNANGGSTSQVTDIPTAEVVRELDRVYGRQPFRCVWLPSPLEFQGTEVEMLWHFRDDVSGILVGSMPIMGITGPCDPVGDFTLAMAECLGGAAIVAALFPDTPLSLHIHPEPADLRSGNIIFGTPEWQWLDLLHRDVHEFLGLHSNGKNVYTPAPIPNVEAQIDRMASIMNAARRGCRDCGPLGILSNDEVWSPAQLILDLEMIDYAKRMYRLPDALPEFAPSALPDLVDEVIRSGGIFAEHDSTIDHMRTQYRQPRILQRLSHAQWSHAGRPDLLAEVHAYADALVAAYDYQPPQEIMTELQRVYEWGREKLLIRT